MVGEGPRPWEARTCWVRGGGEDARRRASGSRGVGSAPWHPPSPAAQFLFCLGPFGRDMLPPKKKKRPVHNVGLPPTPPPSKGTVTDNSSTRLRQDREESFRPAPDEVLQGWEEDGGWAGG